MRNNPNEATFDVFGRLASNEKMTMMMMRMSKRKLQKSKAINADDDDDENETKKLREIRHRD